MIRQIKYRAFDGVSMIYPVGVNQHIQSESLTSGDILNRYDNPMASIGVFVKNVELWIGDVFSHNELNVVLVELDIWGITGIAIDRNFGTILKDGNLMNVHHSYKLQTIHNIRKHIKIVGDIYQNPELLK